jgi:hypothetical protein
MFSLRIQGGNLSTRDDKTAEVPIRADMILSLSSTIRNGSRTP